MNWKEQLKKLENEDNFDIAVFLLEQAIKEQPDNIDVYLFLVYRLVNSIVENSRYWAFSKDPLREIKKEYYDHKSDYYRGLLRHYFDMSYTKFSNNPEYLFYASGLLIPSYWFCGLDNLTDDFLEAMQQKAFDMNYNAILAKEYYYIKLAERNAHDMSVIAYAQQLVHDTSLQEQLINKGILAEYIFGMTLEWAKKVLEKS